MDTYKITCFACGSDDVVVDFSGSMPANDFYNNAPLHYGLIGYSQKYCLDCGFEAIVKQTVSKEGENND